MCLLLQVFVQDAEVQGRYKLVAERLSRPGELPTPCRVKCLWRHGCTARQGGTLCLHRLRAAA